MQLVSNAIDASKITVKQTFFSFLKRLFFPFLALDWTGRKLIHVVRNQSMHRNFISKKFLHLRANILNLMEWISLWRIIGFFYASLLLWALLNFLSFCIDIHCLMLWTTISTFEKNLAVEWIMLKNVFYKKNLCSNSFSGPLFRP